MASPSIILINVLCYFIQRLSVGAHRHHDLLTSTVNCSKDFKHQHDWKLFQINPASRNSPELYQVTTNHRLIQNDLFGTNFTDFQYYLNAFSK